MILLVHFCSSVFYILDLELRSLEHLDSLLWIAISTLIINILNGILGPVSSKFRVSWFNSCFFGFWNLTWKWLKLFFILCQFKINLIHFLFMIIFTFKLGLGFKFILIGRFWIYSVRKLPLRIHLFISIYILIFW